MHEISNQVGKKGGIKKRHRVVFILPSFFSFLTISNFSAHRKSLKTRYAQLPKVSFVRFFPIIIIATIPLSCKKEV